MRIGCLAIMTLRGFPFRSHSSCASISGRTLSSRRVREGGHVRLVGNSRRLPIYLLVDTSASMHGAPIEAVNTGLQSFGAALRQDPQALECAAVSIITFASDARQLTPLIDAGAFTPPALTTEGGTNLGAALR